MPAPFYLVGPTAVGKTSLALEIAERCGAEIVGADAFQVYAGLDLLTAKATPEDRRRVPHHLIGNVPLSVEYNVARYLEEARHCLAGIAARGRRAIVVGGSGLYVRALTHGLSPLPPPRPELRAELEQMDVAQLTERLRTLDGEATAMIDAKNKRRLIRAIEICEATGERFSASRALWQQPAPASTAHGFFLTREPCDLQARIKARVEALISGGALAEVQREAHTTFSMTAEKVIGMADLRSYLRGEQDLPACLASIETATRRYAKRQMTWFRGKSDFESVNLSNGDDRSVIDRSVARIQST